MAAAAHHSGAKSAQAQAAEQAQNDQIADLQAQQQAPPQAAPPPPAPAPAAGGTDLVAELTSLKGLLDAGILTQAEFDAQKQKVLDAQ